MLLTDVSLRRPVLATVLNLLIVLSGLAMFGRLPVREYPDIDNPVVAVRTTYTGASPQTVEASITEPLEQTLNGVDGIRSVTSVSSLGQSSIEVEFESGRDIDLALTDVTNAIQRGLRNIPEEADRPIVSKTGANTRPIIWLYVTSREYSPVDLSDIADRIVKTPLQLLPGVAEVLIGGERRYAMRVWLDPDKMAERGVDPADVRRTILANNLRLPAGQIEAQARQFTVLADGQIDEPRTFESLIIRDDGDVRVRISDVGWVELGSENYTSITRYSAEPIIGLGIVRQSRANELEVSDAIQAALPRIRAALPEGVRLETAVDNTVFVRASLREVWKTLAIAFVLVVLVNLFFLRSIATTVITSIAIPVSLVGTFAAMWLLGFSVNLLTLLSLVLVIGVLVDDAIVVLENIYRRQETGESRPVAADRGAREVGFAVIATTVALVAVLIPLSLLTGSTGRLFREFALTMAVAVSISTFVALTLVPVLCAKFLTLAREHGTVYGAIERTLSGLEHGYDGALAWSVRHRRTIAAFLLVIVVASALLFTLIPSTFVPVEDRGRIVVAIRAPQGSTLAYTFETLKKVEKRLQREPAVAGFFAAIGLNIGGPGNTANGFMAVRLKPWDERDVKQQALVATLLPEFIALPQALVFPINPPSLGQQSLSDVDLVIQSASASLDELAEVTDAVTSRLRERPDLVNVDTDLRLDDPQLDVVFNREAIGDLGVSVEDVSAALQILLAQGQTNEFILRGKQYDVVTALASRFRTIPEQIGQIHVRSGDGHLVPLSGLVDVVPRIAPAALHRYDLQHSATVTANLAAGAALGPALAGVEATVREALPPGFSLAWRGQSREYRESSLEIYLTFAVALVFIYLVLAAQFENFFHPITILVSVPLAALGALLALEVTGNSINLYSQIGMILLLGLVTKNSILLVDYANQDRARGMKLLDAVVAAGKTRFRPIMMTSVTSIFGAIPLGLATGAGAESRHPIGAVVIGGLLFSTAFTLLVIPVVYLGVTRVAEALGIGMIPPLVELGGNDDHAE